MYKPNSTLAQLDASAGADEKVLRTLVHETNALVISGTQRYSRYGLMFDTRYALWDGQNDEGTKEAEDAFPWPGASDTRVRLADRVIRNRCRLRKAAFWGKRLIAKAIRGVNSRQRPARQHAHEVDALHPGLAHGEARDGAGLELPGHLRMRRGGLLLETPHPPGNADARPSGARAPGPRAPRGGAGSRLAHGPVARSRDHQGIRGHVSR
jgi:hypothetical protein